MCIRDRRDARAEQRAGRLLGRYLEPGPDTMGNGLAAHYDAYEEDEVYRFLDEGIPALLAEGEVYLTDAFRSMQAAPPKISVGVSVHGSVLDLSLIHISDKCHCQKGNSPDLQLRSQSQVKWKTM